MTKVQEHGSAPPDLKSPVYRHSSESNRSTNDAGGKIERSSYADRTPGLDRNKA
jgi:hypothetical protein